MRIWVDADAAPRDVKEIVQNAARRLELHAVFVANARLILPPANRFVTAVRVEGGPDAADAYIAEHADAGDVAVTADIPLAAILVEKKVVTIDPRGELFSTENIGEKLSVRNFMDGMRGAGIDTPGARPFGPKDKQNFANAFDRALAKVPEAGMMECWPRDWRSAEPARKFASFQRLRIRHERNAETACITVYLRALDGFFARFSLRYGRCLFRECVDGTTFTIPRERTMTRQTISAPAASYPTSVRTASAPTLSVHRWTQRATRPNLISLASSRLVLSANQR